MLYVPFSSILIMTVRSEKLFLQVKKKVEVGRQTWPDQSTCEGLNLKTPVIFFKVLLVLVNPYPREVSLPQVRAHIHVFDVRWNQQL